jgi:uncharacterized protein (DUF169 family)
MDAKFQQKFIELWRKFFDDAELPITFYYTDEVRRAEPANAERCLIAALFRVRNGKPICIGTESIECLGGRKYLGFREEDEPDVEYYLSYGIVGKLEGERYKKTPQLVAESLRKEPKFKAPARFAVFKRWDLLTESDTPEVVVFFASPDVLSGLFALANFDEAEPNSVFCPDASGCSSIVHYPYLEKDASRPRAVIGMFDVSPRPSVPAYSLSFAVPMSKFERMVHNMEESFLTTKSWERLLGRIQKARQ